MTEKLFYENSYIKEFHTVVAGCEKVKEHFEITLEKTAFFPEGGGQPGDKGFIGDAKVLDTIERGEEIIHICDKAAQGQVDCKIDWDFRFLNMQLHTGEHIFSGFVHQATGFDNVGFHMGEKDVTVDFNGFISAELLNEIEDKTNDAIYRNIPIEVIYPTREELSSFDYRSKKEIEGQVRLVKIEGVDLCACCGTHTEKTGEVGVVKVVSCMNYKQGVRISLQIGKRALLDYREKNESVAKISASLCAKTEVVASAVEKLKEKLNESGRELNETKKKLFSLMCENASAEMPLVFDDAGNADNARILADILKDKVKIAFAFSGNDNDGYKYSVASSTENLRDFSKEFNAALNGRGGGKPEMIMGSVTAKKDEIMEFVRSMG